MPEETNYRFSFGPWNIGEGADPFGPEVRTPYAMVQKLDWYRPLGYEGVQFHDDDVVGWSNSTSKPATTKPATKHSTTKHSTPTFSGI